MRGGERGGDSRQQQSDSAEGSWRMAPGGSAGSRRTRGGPTVSPARCPRDRARVSRRPTLLGTFGSGSAGTAGGKRVRRLRAQAARGTVIPAARASCAPSRSRFQLLFWVRRTFRTRFFSGLGAELGAVSEPGPGSAELRSGPEHVDQRRGAEPSRSCDPKTPKLSRVQGPEQGRSEPGGAVARTGSQSGFGLKCGRLVQKRGVGGRSFNCVTRRGTETGGVVARSACGL